MNNLLTDRDTVASRIRYIVCETTGSWGLEVLRAVEGLHKYLPK